MGGRHLFTSDGRVHPELLEDLAAEDWSFAYLPYESEELRRSGASPTVPYDEGYEMTVVVWQRAAAMPGGGGGSTFPWDDGRGPGRTRQPMPFDIWCDLYDVVEGELSCH